ncbi:hypothetical protein LCGC14_1716190 [marine sediment metagenome]|uniref:Phage ABA sandwich domain-containing protein n=1 Tax=marine sediment metagenome TaxID=412755 RepID=A0A0F9JU60_9ZZZZ
MDTKNKVVSLELAQKMAKLGWDYEVERYWRVDEFGNVYLRVNPKTDTIANLININKKKGTQVYYPAPDAIEIGEQLPDRTTNKKWLTCQKVGLWEIGYGNKETDVSFEVKSEAEARGKMWCYLKEKELI